MPSASGAVEVQWCWHVWTFQQQHGSFLDNVGVQQLKYGIQGHDCIQSGLLIGLVNQDYMSIYRVN